MRQAPLALARVGAEESGAARLVIFRVLTIGPERTGP